MALPIRPRRTSSLIIACLALIGGLLVPLVTSTAQPASGDTGEGASAPASVDAGKITGGGLHTCGVEDDGSVQCWGANDNGQLGNGTTAHSTTPTPVLGITTAVSVAAGDTHTCAVIHDGTVQCWGNNGNGQLGNPVTVPPDPPTAMVPTPVGVIGLTDATEITAGQSHTCALRADSSVVCWGHNASGQLGDGAGSGITYLPTEVVHDDDADASTEPVPLDGITAIAAGEFHTCAIRGATGEVYCWGHNGFGQLGDNQSPPPGEVPEDRATAVGVVGIPEQDPDDPEVFHGAVAIAAGESHTCAILDDNTARCWGDNFYGQLGDGAAFTEPATEVTKTHDAPDSLVPVPVVHDDDDSDLTPPVPLDGLTSISAGKFHTCAGLGGGDAYCWGNNGRGQLAQPVDPEAQNQSSAAPVAGLPADARAVTTGGFHTCALAAGNDVYCWGYNFFGQLGSYRDSVLAPVAVTALKGATDVTTGAFHACARRTTPSTEDEPVCWGDNHLGELGAGLAPSPADSTIPVEVVGMQPSQPLSAGNDHVCALPSGSQTPRCWGGNVSGELGDGTNTNSDVPVTVSGITTATQLDAGGTLADPGGGPVELGHTCARLSDGTARCWGANHWGQLGDTTTANSNVPVAVQSDHDDDHLDTPPPDLSSPEELMGVVTVSVGGLHACALTTTQNVRCWGSNAHGQLGDGTNGDRHYAVTADLDPLEPDPDETGDEHFDALDSVVQVVAGDRHTCALQSDGDVWCWGRNNGGQLGDGSTTSRDHPVLATAVMDAVSGLFPITGIVDLSAGGGHTCARALDTRGNTIAVCWGANDHGQLGTGSTAATQTSPVSPVGLGPASDELDDIELVVALRAGRANTCAVLIDTTVRCWGDNSNGQVGDGVGEHSHVPLLVGEVGSVGGNELPVAEDDVATTPESTPVSIPVLANDTDPDGDALTVTGVTVTSPTGGRGTASTDGTLVTYTPEPDFCALDQTSFTETLVYEVTDGTGTVPAGITVTVQCPNAAPVALDVSVTVPEDATTQVDVLAAASDANGDALQVAAASTPAHGTASVLGDGSAIDYTPDPDYVGADSFTFVVTDGIDDSNLATVHVTVSNVNDAPVAVDDNASTIEGQSVVVDVVANDTDVDGDALSVATTTDPPKGSAQVLNQSDVRYTPAPGTCGADSFGYTVSDGQVSDTATVVVDVACVNDGPVAEDDSATTVEDSPVVIDVLANDHDPEGDPLTIVQVSQPAHGQTAHDGATVTYTPDPDYCGPDGFGYVISDGTTTSAGYVAPVHVVCNQDAPDAVDDDAVASEDTVAVIEVLPNDVDVDGDTLSVVSATDPAHGAALVTSTFRVRYTPDPDHCGTDSFDYTVRDPGGLTDTATVTVTIGCVNDAPSIAAVPDQSTEWGAELGVALSSSDPDGDAVSYQFVAGPGSIVGSSFVWTPSGADVGSHEVTVRVNDGELVDDDTFVVAVAKRPTAIAYDGATSGQFSDPAGAAATLVDDGAGPLNGSPVSGGEVALQIGSSAATASTDASGSATSGVAVVDPVGSVPATATFDGSSAYLGSATSETFEVIPEDLVASFAGPRVVTSDGPAPLHLVAELSEPDDATPGWLAGVEVTFTEVGGDPLCSASVIGPAVGSAVVACDSAPVAPGARAIVVSTSGGSHLTAVDVGTTVVAADGVAAGAGRVLAADDRPGDFAFHGQPGAKRKDPPTGSIVHVYRGPGEATVVAADELDAYDRACSKGKDKTCTLSLAGADAERWGISLGSGAVTLLAGNPTITIDAFDAGSQPIPDTYGAQIGAPDDHTQAIGDVIAGLVDLL